MLRTFLVCGARIAEGSLDKYSVHSFRITLATLLFSLKVPVDTIKRLLRWRSDDSVLIYGRLSDAESRSLVLRTMSVSVDSRVAPRLVTIPVDVNVFVGGADPGEAIDGGTAFAGLGCIGLRSVSIYIYHRYC